MGRGKQIAKWMRLDKITPWDKNPRHNAEAVEPLAKAILRFGFDQPIVVWGSQGNRIVKGHTRRLALLWLFDKVPERAEGGTITGWRTRGEEDEPFVLQGAPGPGSVPVEVREYDSEEHYKAAAVSDNRLGELAQWDDQGLQEILGGIESPELIDGLGWEADELEDLIQVSGYERGISETPVPDPDPVSQDPPDSKPGKVYQLGPHLLVCGSSTDPNTWEQMGGGVVDAIWTDPPYGIAYVGKTKDALTIQNDALDRGELEVFLRSALGLAVASLRPGGACYVAAPSGDLVHVFGTVLLELEVWRHTLAWVKDRFVLGRSDYHYRHETIFYGWKPGAAHYFVSERTHDSVLEFARPSANREHPTMKPIPLVAYCIENSTLPGETVCDPFGGSGTTLLAAATTGRVCKTIELDPRYCDVIRRRWTAWAKAEGIDPGPGALEPE